MNNQSIYEELGLKPSCELSSIDREILLDKASVLKSLYRQNVTEDFEIITSNNGYFMIACYPSNDFKNGDIQYNWYGKHGFAISDGYSSTPIPLSLLENIKFSNINFNYRYKISFVYGELEQIVCEPRTEECIHFPGFVFTCHPINPIINPQKREPMILRDLGKVVKICQAIEKKNKLDKPIKFLIS